MDMIEPEEVEPSVWYGIWLAGIGWWKQDDDTGRIFVTQNIDLARQQAKWFGGKVLIIDESLKDFEKQMLGAEREQAQRKRKYGLFRRN